VSLSVDVTVIVPLLAETLVSPAHLICTLPFTSQPSLYCIEGFNAQFVVIIPSLCGLAGSPTLISVPLTVATTLLLSRAKVSFLFTTVPSQLITWSLTFTQILPFVVPFILIQVLRSAILLQLSHFLSQILETRSLERSSRQAYSQILIT
jgi:hypothetical protein